MPPGLYRAFEILALEIAWNRGAVRQSHFFWLLAVFEVTVLGAHGAELALQDDVLKTEWCLGLVVEGLEFSSLGRRA